MIHPFALATLATPLPPREYCACGNRLTDPDDESCSVECGRKAAFSRLTVREKPLPSHSQPVPYDDYDDDHSSYSSSPPTTPFNDYSEDVLASLRASRTSDCNSTRASPRDSIGSDEDEFNESFWRENASALRSRNDEYSTTRPPKHSSMVRKLRVATSRRLRSDSPNGHFASNDEFSTSRPAKTLVRKMSSVWRGGSSMARPATPDPGVYAPLLKQYVPDVPRSVSPPSSLLDDWATASIPERSLTPTPTATPHEYHYPQQFHTQPVAPLKLKSSDSRRLRHAGPVVVRRISSVANFSRQTTLRRPTPGAPYGNFRD